MFLTLILQKESSDFGKITCQGLEGKLYQGWDLNTGSLIPTAHWDPLRPSEIEPVSHCAPFPAVITSKVLLYCFFAPTPSNYVSNGQVSFFLLLSLPLSHTHSFVERWKDTFILVWYEIHTWFGAFEFDLSQLYGEWISEGNLAFCLSSFGLDPLPPSAFLCLSVFSVLLCLRERRKERKEKSF